MNQILSMNGGVYNLDENNGFNFNQKGPQKLDRETTIKIFAISLIVFGAILLIVGIVGLVSNLSKPKVNMVEWPKFDIYDEAGTVYVSITHNEIIDKVVYYWNNGFITEQPGNNTKTLDFTIEALEGPNVLNLTVVDVKGNEKEYSNTFTGIASQNTEKPVIELSISGSKLNIVGKTTNDVLLSNLTYKWDTDNAETRVEATSDKKVIEVQTNVPKGTHTLVMTLTNENGIKTTLTKKFVGAIKPTITVEQNEKKLRITVEHESGIESMSIIHNGRNIALTADRFGEDKVKVEFALNLSSGENTIKVVAKSYDGTSEEFNGVANYR